MTADRFIAWGEAHVSPDDHRWYAVAWDTDDGPLTSETLHDDARAAYLAARRLAETEGLEVEYCDEYGVVPGGWVAMLGNAGWGITHENDRSVWIADGYVTEGGAWQAAGMSDSQNLTPGVMTGEENQT